MTKPPSPTTIAYARPRRRTRQVDDDTPSSLTYTPPLPKSAYRDSLSRNCQGACILPNGNWPRATSHSSSERYSKRASCLSPSPMSSASCCVLSRSHNDYFFQIDFSCSAACNLQVIKQKCRPHRHSFLVVQSRKCETRSKSAFNIQYS